MPVPEQSKSVSSRQKLLLLGMGVAVLAGVSVLVIVRTGNSCERIFNQTAPKLEAHLEIIEQKGAIAVGHDQIQELSESAQKVGIHLKTCCSVLDGGKLGPEQFQQCIDTASAYDRQVALVAQQITEVAKSKELSAADVPQEKIANINRIIQTASAEAENFGRRVVQLKPRPQPAKPTPGPSSKRVSSKIPGISAELIEFSIFANTITLKVRFVNDGTGDQKFRPSESSGNFHTSYLLDEVTGKRYQGTAHASRSVSVPEGGGVEFWAKYLLPEGDKPRYLTAVLNHGIMFEHLELL